MSAPGKTPPSLEQLKAELKRERHRRTYGVTLRSTIYSLITVAAVAVLVATLFLPVLQIYGESMTPTLYDGDVVVSVKTGQLERGDVVAFYYNNKILVKRVIAGARSVGGHRRGRQRLRGRRAAGTNPMCRIKPWAPVTSPCPIKSQTAAGSSWEITAPSR